jgi:hypothetical protein
VLHAVRHTIADVCTQHTKATNHHCAGGGAISVVVRNNAESSTGIDLFGNELRRVDDPLEIDVRKDCRRRRPVSAPGGKQASLERGEPLEAQTCLGSSGNVSDTKLGSGHRLFKSDVNLHYTTLQLLFQFKVFQTGSDLTRALPDWTELAQPVRWES